MYSSDEEAQIGSYTVRSSTTQKKQKKYREVFSRAGAQKKAT